MKIIVSKENEELITKYNDGGVESDFDYIRFIEDLYNKREVEIEIDQTIDKELRAEIEKMFDDIKNVFKQK